MKSALKSRPFLWLVLALPGLWMLWHYAMTPDEYSYGQIIGDSGDWAAWLLMVTLAVTPVRLLFRRQAWAQYLLRHRRDLGVASFAYALGHTVIYLLRKADPRTTEDTWHRMGSLLDHFSAEECANYLTNAGYAST